VLVCFLSSVPNLVHISRIITFVLSVRQVTSCELTSGSVFLTRDHFHVVVLHVCTTFMMAVGPISHKNFSHDQLSSVQVIYLNLLSFTLESSIYVPRISVLGIPFFSYLTLNNIVTLKSGLEVTQGHSNWHHSKAWVRFPIRLP